jgi:hypothetical protein
MNKIDSRFVISPNMFKNLIINGDFQIWQRGTSFLNQETSSYTADRWLCWTSKEFQGITWSITKQYYSGDEFRGNTLKMEVISYDGNGEGVWGVAQRVEIDSKNWFYFLDKKYTYQIWIRTNKNKASIYRGILAIDESGNKTYVELGSDIHSVDSDNWTKLTGVYELTYDNVANALKSVNENFTVENNLYCVELLGVKLGKSIDGKSPQTGDYFEIAFAQVEEGEIATEFEYVPFDIQLLRCMRYYEVINSAVAWKAPFDDDTYGYAQFKVTKRTIPTVMFIRPSDNIMGGADYFYWTGTLNTDKVGVEAFHVTRDGLGFGNKAYTPGNTNDAHLITHIIADAEL